MALPKHRHSKTRRDMRRTHQKLTAPNLTPCPSCGAMKLTHHMCPECKEYKGRKVIEETIE